MRKGSKKPATTHYRLASMEDLQQWWQEHEVDGGDTYANSSSLSKRDWKVIAGGAILALVLAILVFPVTLLFNNAARSIATTAPGTGVGGNTTSTVIDSYETIDGGDTYHEQTFTYNVDANNFGSWKTQFRAYQSEVFRDEPNLVNLTVNSAKHGMTILNYTGTEEERIQVQNLLETFERFGDIGEYGNVSLEADLETTEGDEQGVTIDIRSNQTLVTLEPALRRAYMLLPEETFDQYNYTVNLTVDTEPLPVPVTIRTEIPDAETVLDLVTFLKLDDTPIRSVTDMFGPNEATEGIIYHLPVGDQPAKLIVTGSFSQDYINQFDQYWATLNAEQLPPLIGELRTTTDETLAYGNWLP